MQYLRSVDILEERVILITPPPLGEAAWEKECILKGEQSMLGLSQLHVGAGGFTPGPCQSTGDQLLMSYYRLF